MKSIRLNIKSRLENVSLVGLAVNKICSAMPFGEDDVYQTELCVVEACNNVIEHAYSNKPDQDIDILIQQHADRIVFDISDRGTPRPALYESNLGFDPNDRSQLPDGGMGLFFIHEIMNEVEYRNQDGRNVLTLTKYCPGKREEP